MILAGMIRSVQTLNQKIFQINLQNSLVIPKKPLKKKL